MSIIDTKKKRSVGEELHDVAIKNSKHNQEVQEKKNLVNSSKKRLKHPLGSCVDPRDRKRGKVKCFSELEIARENIFLDLKGQKHGKREVVGFTDMLLDLITRWPVVSRTLDQEGLISEGNLYDPRGHIRFTVPWLISAIKKEHPQRLEKLLGKSMDQITDRQIRGNASSLFSQLFKTLFLLGLVCKEPEKVGLKGAYAYHFSEEVHKLSLAELAFLIEQGRELQRKIDRGQIKVDAPKKGEKRKPTSKSKQVLEIPPDNNNSEIIKKTVEVLKDGTIRISIYYK